MLPPDEAALGRDRGKRACPTSSESITIGSCLPSPGIGLQHSLHWNLSLLWAHTWLHFSVLPPSCPACSFPSSIRLSRTLQGRSVGGRGKPLALFLSLQIRIQPEAGLKRTFFQS